MRCPICGADRESVFSALVLERHVAEYLKCRECGFLGPRAPWWLEEAYRSPIADVDSGVLARARDLEPRLVCLLRLAFPKDAVFADLGAGYGVLVRAMRDAGLDFRWSDPHCPNLLARGFELNSERCAALTAVEVIEHTLQPLQFVQDAIRRTGASAVVLTTEVLPEPVPSPSSWWYYAFQTGQHIAFFELRTLEELARRLGMRLQSRGNLHVLHSGDVARWTFLLAATRLSRLAARFLRGSFTIQDNALLRPSGAPAPSRTVAVEGEAVRPG